MSDESIDVLNELRKFQRTYMMCGLHEEADSVGVIFSAVSNLIEAATDALKYAGPEYETLRSALDRVSQKGRQA